MGSRRKAARRSPPFPGVDGRPADGGASDYRLRRGQEAVRLAAAVEHAVDRGTPADRALAARFRARTGYGARDRRGYAEAVFALQRWRGWCGRLDAEGPRALVRAHWLDAVQAHPPIVALARALGVPYAGEPPWGGRPLAARAAALAVAEGRDAPPRPEALVPAWFPPMLALPDADDGTPALAGVIDAFQVRPPLWLRAAGTDGAALAARLAGAGLVARVHPVRTEAVALDAHPHLPGLAREIGAGFHVQDLASQAVVACCAARPGETWWDACAGAGGKTWPLADAVGPRGQVLATDIRPAALDELGRRHAAFPAARCTVRRGDAGRPPAGAAFDGVLLDAPCVGTGTWSRSPDARWRTDPGRIAQAAARQARLIAAAATAVRPGGRLVYAVCSLTREETTRVAVGFLDRHPDFEPLEVPAPLGGAPAAAHWIHPAAGPCTGMFIAAFRRRA